MLPGDTFDCLEPIFAFCPRPTVHGDGQWLKPNNVYFVVSVRPEGIDPDRNYSTKRSCVLLGPGVKMVELEL